MIFPAFPHKRGFHKVDMIFAVLIGNRMDPIVGEYDSHLAGFSFCGMEYYGTLKRLILDISRRIRGNSINLNNSQ